MSFDQFRSKQNLSNQDVLRSAANIRQKIIDTVQHLDEQQLEKLKETLRIEEDEVNIGEENKLELEGLEQQQEQQPLKEDDEARSVYTKVSLRTSSTLGGKSMRSS